MKNIFIVLMLLISSAAFAQIEQPVVKITDSLSGGPSTGSTTLQSPLYVINGVLSTPEEFRKIKSENIVSVSVLKNAEETEHYGKSGGVILIKTKDGLSKKELREVEREQKKLSKQYKRGQ